MLHFINFRAISENMVESKDGEGNKLADDPIRMKRGNTVDLEEGRNDWVTLKATGENAEGV